MDSRSCGDGRLGSLGGVQLADGGHKQWGAERSQTVIASDHRITRYNPERYEFVTIPRIMASAPPLSS
ncbi:MAG: hypothetical protein WB762_17975 [Candidatus Sulfotelmatobacter sp.]